MSEEEVTFVGRPMTLKDLADLLAAANKGKTPQERLQLAVRFELDRNDDAPPIPEETPD